jgi:phosphomannomutase
MIFVFLSMEFPDHIFKAYDIRGLVDSELSEELFYRLGRAAVVLTGARRVMAGYDMRPSSIPYAAAFRRGARDQGADTVDIGLISTPMLNVMTMRDPSADLGAMITASHNPQEYNGCKFMNKKTMLPIGLASGLADLREMVRANAFPIAAQAGAEEARDIHDAYAAYTHSLVDTSGVKPLRVAFDFGNGIEGVIIDRIVSRLPITTEYLYKEPDGRFPNHEANPLKHETLRDLQKTVKSFGADMGFAYDGDADRIGLVDENGDIIPGDMILALLVPELLARAPGAPVLYDLRSSRAVKEQIEAYGGVPVESRVGRTLIIEEMRARDAVLGGELSCHFYYRDLYGFESGDLTLLYLLKILSASGKKLSELAAPLRRYHHSGEINFEVADKAAALARIEAAFSSGSNRLSHLDGVKIEHKDWWCSVRQSNTEPVLRLIVEADTEFLMQ